MKSFLKLFALLLIASRLLPAGLHAQTPDSVTNGFAPLPNVSVPASANAASVSAAGGSALPARLAANAADHLLMPGDLVEVKVFQEPDMDSTLRVAQDGVIVFPLIDRVKVGGLTPLVAAKTIQQLLDKDYLVNPQVQLLVLEFARRSFTVLGEVQKPGSYDMPDGSEVSLLQAIGMSGGYTRVANPASVTVKRRVKDHEVVFRLNARRMAAGSGSHFNIQPDDVVTVAESIF